MAHLPRGSTRVLSLRALEDGRWVARRARVATEEAWTVEFGFLNKAGPFFCTPADLEALAVGHLLNEGYCLPADIEMARVHRRLRVVRVRTRRVEHEPSRPLPRVAPRTVTPGAIFKRTEEMLEGARLYKAARGVHTSALADGRGLRWLVEDVGKYNTLDKLRGLAHLQGRPTRGLTLLTTGRLTGGMVSKGLRMGVPVMATIGGTTAEGVRLARAGGAALIGYVRGRSLNLYAGRPAE
ncbi:MAG: formate dehydrogenase accessory sulfurtransferase FdhD [Halobacteria archaeon]